MFKNPPICNYMCMQFCLMHIYGPREFECILLYYITLRWRALTMNERITGKKILCVMCLISHHIQKNKNNTVFMWYLHISNIIIIIVLQTCKH